MAHFSSENGTFLRDIPAGAERTLFQNVAYGHRQQAAGHTGAFPYTLRVYNVFGSQAWVFYGSKAKDMEIACDKQLPAGLYLAVLKQGNGAAAQTFVVAR